MATDRYIVEGIFDDQMSKPLDDLTKQIVDSFAEVDNGAAELRDEMRRLDTAISEGKGWDELRSRLRSTLDNVQEFGGSLAQQQQALQAIENQARASGQPIALVANAMRLMVDESEDVTGSIKNLGLVMDLASAKMLKTEDAGRLMGRVMRGDVSALRELSPAAAKAADAIAKIPDPAKRAAEGMRVIRAEAGGARSAMGEISASFAQADVALARLGFAGVSSAMVLGSLATAAAGATAAMGKLTFDAMLKFQQSTDDGRKRLERFNAEVARAQLQWGEAASKATDFDKVIENNTARIKILNDAFDDSGESAGGAGEKFGKLGVILAGLMAGMGGPLVAAVAGATAAFDYLAGTEEEVAVAARNALPGLTGLGIAVEQGVGPVANLTDASATLSAQVGGLGESLRFATTDAANFATAMAAAAAYLGPDGKPLPIGPLTKKGEFEVKKPPKRGGGGRKKKATIDDASKFIAGLAASVSAAADPASRAVTALLDDASDALKAYRKNAEEELARFNRAIKTELTEPLKRARDEFQRFSAEDLGARFDKMMSGEVGALKSSFDRLMEARKGMYHDFSADVRQSLQSLDRQAETAEAIQAAMAEYFTAKYGEEYRFGEAVQDGLGDLRTATDVFRTFRNVGEQALLKVADAAFTMTDALGTGEMKLKDVRNEIGTAFGTILADMGEELAMAAIKQGAVIALFGEAMAALSAGSPGVAIVAGLALVAAGTALKKFSQDKGKGRAGRADNKAAGAVERLGRDIIGRTQDAARPVYISIEGRTMRGYTTDVMNDAMRRGQVVVTPRRV